MYLLNLSYSQHPDAVQPHVASHGAWVKKHIDNGNLLFAGPKQSGLGGVALVRSMSRAELQSVIDDDSYAQANVAEYQVIEFACKIAASQLGTLLQA